MPPRVVARIVVLALGGAGAMLAAGLVWLPLAAVPLVVGLALVWAFVPQAFPGRTLVHGSETGDAFALTFDDGPNAEHTRAILDALGREGVRATFFVTGEAAARHPELVRSMVERGHVVGSHGMRHRKLLFLGPRAIARELEEARQALVEAGAPRPTLFRAPHGFRSPFLGSVLRREGLTLCAWTHGVWDTDRPGVDVIVRRAKKALRPGAVLLLHDGPPGADRSQTAQAVPAIVAAARARGLRFATLPEMMGKKDG